MLSYLNSTHSPHAAAKAAKAAQQVRGKGLKEDAMSIQGTSMPPPSDDGLEAMRGEGLVINVASPFETKKKKTKAPQDALDEFWKKFDSKTPGRATTILPKNRYAKKVGEAVPKGVISGKSAVASYEEAAKNCKAKVDKIVRECSRVNQKYRDPHFDMDFDLKWEIYDCLNMLSGTPDDEPTFRPGSVKRVGDIFDKPEFFKGGATANDIRQGRDGDCWFLSALCALGGKSELIEKVCVARDEKVGVYGFVFYRDGEWISEVIDDKLYLLKPDYDESWLERVLIEDRQRINSEEDYRKIYQSGSGALFFAQCEDPNETWLPLLEKAYAKAHGDYAAIEGGATGEGLEDLTGGVTSEIFSSDILDKEYFWKEELMKVNDEFLFGCAAGIFGGRGDRKGIVEGHAYSILKAVEIDGQRLCLVRNPWGTYEWNGPWSDGSKEWTPEWMQKLGHTFGDDGQFWMSYDDLLKKYQTFDKTRLFDDQWQVTQQWTPLTVAWSTDYHSTKFSFSVKRTAPVVLVLSNLDDRYFQGLEGQYRFQLSFRVHKSGEDDYLIRSHGNYWMRRSVTAELELEPGEYHVLVKVEAEKIDDALPVEDVVRNNAKARRNKLLQVGLTYDLAHAKGEIKVTDEEKALQKNLEAKKKARERKEMKDKLMKDKKKQIHNQNKELRKQRVAAEKRKAKAKAKKEKREKLEAAKREKEGAEATQQEPKTEEVTPAEIKTEEPKEPITAPDNNFKNIAKQDMDMQVALLAQQNKRREEMALQEQKVDDDPAAAPEPKKDELAPAPVEIRLNNSSVPPSIAGSSQAEDSDSDLSDIESICSDISVSVIDDAIAEAALVAEAALANAPTNDDSEDEFDKDPWNAIAVVGLRIYTKGGGVAVNVVRPRVSDDEDEKAETRLDVDDSAADATKGVDITETTEEGRKEGTAAGSMGESEGSIVMV